MGVQKQFNPEKDCVGSNNGYCVENALQGCANRCFSGATKAEIVTGSVDELKFMIESLFAIRDMTEPENRTE